MSDITPSIRLSPTKPSSLTIRIQPVVKPLRLREPRKALVVSLAGGDDATGLDHTLHLPEDSHWVLDMLKDLVAEDDIEGCVRVLEGVGVRNLKGAILDSATPCHVGTGALQDCFDRVDAGDFALWHELGEVRGDSTRATANVQDCVVRLQMWQEKGGAVLRRPSGMAVHYAGVMAVSVSRLFLSSGHLHLSTP